VVSESVAGRGGNVHVVVEVGIRRGSNLERLVAACRCPQTVSVRDQSHRGGRDSPETIAFVLAIAGMILLTTPCVKLQVTPSILYCSARVRAVSKSHWICSGSSLSTFLSTRAPSVQIQVRWRELDKPLKTRGHSRMDAHSMQCSGSRGVLAMVQMGKAVGGVSMSRLHS
jgi:hypothetical protein